ncbi:PAAR domain-containing protein [Phormidesmis sp. 146-35]
MSPYDVALKQAQAEDHLQEEAAAAAAKQIKQPPIAARIGDAIFVALHPSPAFPPVLTPPGTGSPTVWIGGRPAWRALPAKEAAAIKEAKTRSNRTLAEAKAARTVATGTPEQTAAVANEEKTKLEEKVKMANLLTKAASLGTDLHGCTHGVGAVETGSSTVLINGLPASRVGDKLTEASGPPNVIMSGEPTVWIGD